MGMAAQSGGRAMNAKAGRPRDEAKGEAILKAAGECFLKLGFEGASMDAIAAEAGVSKLTVYNHYGSKESLFKQVIHGKCAEFAPAEGFAALVDADPRHALGRIAMNFMRLILQPEVVDMHRVVTGESGRNPKVAELMNEVGPRVLLASFAELLRSWVRRGSMDIPAPDRASDHFFSMLKGHMVQERMLNLRAAPSNAEVKKHVDDCVDMFMRAYGPR